MDFLTFVAAIVGSLAWPLSLLISVFLMRKPLADLIPAIRRLKFKDLEVDFGKELEKIEAEMDTIENEPKPKNELLAEVESEPLPRTRNELIEKIATLSPNAAIIESWRNVERTLNIYFIRRGIEQPVSGQTISRHLDKDPNFPPRLVSAYQELRLLRNLAAHNQERLTAKQAMEFSALADRLAYALIGATKA